MRMCCCALPYIDPKICMRCQNSPHVSSGLQYQKELPSLRQEITETQKELSKDAVLKVALHELASCHGLWARDGEDKPIFRLDFTESIALIEKALE